jgi:hypothetical protein
MGRHIVRGRTHHTVRASLRIHAVDAARWDIAVVVQVARNSLAAPAILDVVLRSVDLDVPTAPQSFVGSISVKKDGTS